MNRRGFLNGLGLGLATLPLQTLAKEPTLKRTEWAGKEAYSLPPLHIKSLHPDHLTKAWYSIQDHDYMVGEGWFNPWDLRPLIESNDRDIVRQVDRETHWQINYGGVRGYLWGTVLAQAFFVPSRTFFLVSDDYSEEPDVHDRSKYPWPMLVQKVTFDLRNLEV